MNKFLSAKTSAQSQKKTDFSKHKEITEHGCMQQHHFAKDDAMIWIDWVFSFSDNGKKLSLPKKDRENISSFAAFLAHGENMEKEFYLFVDSVKIFGTFYGKSEERLEDMKTLARVIGMDSFIGLCPSSVSLLHAVISSSRNHKDISEGLSSLEKFMGMGISGRQFEDLIENIVKNGERNSIIHSIDILSSIQPGKYTAEMMKLMETITRNTWGCATSSCLGKAVNRIGKGGINESWIKSLNLQVEGKYGSNLEMMLNENETAGKAQQ
ncbi:MAG: hypothetical protein NTY68_02025 [Candidatus Micrarchaeota archaeon]|nr:hypothetical protein [Candidatus Micrarchaeota archaeon]